MIFKMALCQMMVSLDKEENLLKAETMVREAAQHGARVVALPEMFNCPYANRYFREYGEAQGDQTFSRLSALARELQIYLIGGSVPELASVAGPEGEAAEEARVYNTCYAFNPSGELIGKHRKVHLFDINVKGGISFKESDTLTPGDAITLIDTEFGKIGIAICYDVRFPEMFRAMALAGAKAVILPAAFNMTTGPAHWDLTMRARALDNQVYFAAVSPARDVSGVYQAYGHSCIVNPWGEFCGKLDAREGILYGNIDTDYMDSIRDQLPLLKHRKPEIYAR